MLNFKEWSKIAGDEKTSTLQHNKGHVMTIAHDSLPKIQMEQLKRLKMAEGGHVKGVHTSDAKKDDEINSGTSRVGVYSKASKEYQSPVAKKFWKDSAIEQHKKVIGEMKEMGGKDRKYLAEGTPDNTLKAGDEYSDQSPPGSPENTASSPDQVSHDTHITINAAPAPSGTGPNQPQVGISSANPAASVPVPATNPTMEHPGAASNDPYSSVARGVVNANAQQQEAIQQQVPISQAASQMAQPIEGQYIDTRQKIAQMDADNLADVKKHTSDFASYLKANPIRSNAYLEDMGAGQKTATAIGLLLGGFGQGLVGGPNPAMDFLNRQIDRNIASQKDNAGQQKTIWGAYNDLYQNENAATALAKVSANDMLTHQAQLAAAKLGTPQAQQAANALASQKQLENTKNLLDAAAYLTAKDIKGAQSAPKPNQANPNNSVPHGGSAPVKKGTGPDASGVYKIQPILNPNAPAILDNQTKRAKSGDPAAAAQLDRLQSQYNKAKQADEVLSRMPDIYRSLISNATPGGWVGRNNPLTGLGPALATIPVLGPAAAGVVAGAGNLAGEGVTGARRLFGKENGNEFSKERQYEGSKNQLGDMLRTIFPGISMDEYNRKLSSITPDRSDTTQDITHKMKIFEDLVKTSNEFGILHDKGMAK